VRLVNDELDREERNVNVKRARSHQPRTSSSLGVDDRTEERGSEE
jgi:hypothetical protein